MTVYWTGMVVFHSAPLMAALNAERGKVKNEQFNSLFLHLNFISLSSFSTQLSPSLPETTGAERQIWQTHVLPNLHMTLCFLLPGHQSSCCQRPCTLGDTWLKKNTGHILPRITCPQQCGTFLNWFNLLLRRHRVTHLFYSGFHHTWVAGDTC